MLDFRRLIVSFVVLLLIILASSMVVWKNYFQYSSETYMLEGRFESVSGLIKGSDVRYRGYKVGSIKDIKPSPKQVTVYFLVDDNVQIPVGSIFKIRFDGIVGETFLNISPKSDSKNFLSNADVVYGSASSDLSRFLDLGSSGLTQADQLLQQMNQILSSDDFRGKLSSIFVNLQNSSQRLSDLLAHLDKEDLANTVSQSRELMTRANLLLADDTIANLKLFASNSALVSSKLRGFFGGANVDSESDEHNVMSTFTFFKDLNFKSQSALFFSSKAESGFYDADFSFFVKDYFLRLGLGDRLGSAQLLHIQQGIQLTSALDLRLGLYNQEPSIGFDYLFNPMQIELSIYDLNIPKFVFYSSYLMNHRYRFKLGLESIIGVEREWSILSGLSIQF